MIVASMSIGPAELAAIAVPRVFIVKPDANNIMLPRGIVAKGSGVRTTADLHGLRLLPELDFLLPAVRQVCEAGLGFIVSGFTGEPSDVGTGGGTLVFKVPVPPQDPSQRLDSFELSVRAGHCIEALHLVTVGELAAMSTEELLSQPNVGRKTVAELRSLLASVRTDFGATSANVEASAEIASPSWPAAVLEGLDYREVNVALLIRIGDLPLSVRAVNWTTKQGLEYTSDLVRQTRSVLVKWKNLGRKTLDEIEKVLAGYGLNLGMEVPEWVAAHTERLAKLFLIDHKAALAVVSAPEPRALPAQDLEEEIEALLKTCAPERDGKIVSRVLGWDGAGGTTLEKAAQEYGLTRERIRQIVLRIRGRVERAFVSTQWIEKAVDFVSKATPALADDIELALVPAKICRLPFRLEGLANIGPTRGADVTWVVHAVGPARFIVQKGDEKVGIHIRQIANRMVEHFGVGRLEELVSEVRAQFPAVTTEAAQQILACVGDCVAWLDEQKSWFWTTGPRRNRLLNRMRKALGVATELSIKALYDAVFRDVRVQDSIVPREIFESLCQQVPWCEIREGRVRLSGPTPEDELSPNEDTLIRILREHGPVLPRTEFQRYSEEAGVGEVTFSALLSNSPVLVNHGDLWYGIVGTERAEERATDDLEVGQTEVFATVSPAGGIADCDSESLLFPCMAATSLLRRADANGLLARRWSICELALNDADIGRVRRWGEAVHLAQRLLAKQCVRYRDVRLSGIECAALLFLVFCSAVASTEAVEGEMWPEIVSALGHQMRCALFFGNFLPRAWLREATERVCRKLNIRHVFGQEGSQSWLRTVFLQFGVSNSGWERLPIWLAGNPTPVTVSDLVNPQNENRSAEFERLWEKLRARGEDLAAELATNPWVPRGLSRRLLDLAYADRAWIPEDPDAAPFALSALLDIPRLRWVGGRPRFGITLRHAVFPTLRDKAVQLSFDHLPSLIRFDSSGAAAFDVGEPTLDPSSLRIRVDAPELDQTTLLSVLDDGEEVAVFDVESGRKLDVWSLRLHEGRAYAILYRSDVAVTPAAAEWYRIAGGDAVLGVYRSGFPSELTAALGVVVIWTLSEALASERDLPLGCAVCRGGEWGADAEIELALPDGVGVRRARIGSQVLHPRDGRLVLHLKPGVDYSRISKAELHGVADGVPIRVSLDFRLVGSVSGAAVTTGGEWQLIDSSTQLNRSDLARARFRVCPPAFWDGDTRPTETWAILEGSEFLGRPQRSTLSLAGDFIALGDPLEITPGPYNSSGYRRIRIAQRIIDTGEIRAVTTDGARHIITLRRQTEVTSDHTVWRWERGREPQAVSPDACLWDGGVCEIATQPGEIVGWALSYRGERLGSLLADESRLIESTKMDWERIAAWLRWWQAPILAEPLRATVARRVREQPVRTLVAWLTDSIRLPVAQDVGRNVGWHLVRRFFWNWRPSAEEAAALLVDLGLLKGNAAQDLATGWENSEQVLLSHPVLLVSLALKGVPLLYAGASAKEHRVLLLRLCNIILDLPPDASDAMRGEALNQELHTSASEMRVDVAFVWKRLLAEARGLLDGAPVNSENLRIALAVQPLRRWIAVRLLESRIGGR